MEIVYLPLSALRKYEKNAKKHPQSQIEELKHSIELYGMNDPIAVWGDDNTIVEGHGRLEALKQLGITEAPCIRLDHLTDKERREYTIAHNKINADSGMDKKLLSLELPELSLEWLGYDEKKEDDGYYGDARERTYGAVNLRAFDASRVIGDYDMPIIYADKHIPDDLISFNYMLSSHDFDKGIHFYIDDYQFERVWQSPEKYIDKLSRFDCVLTPDFSLYMDMPIAMQIWNVYRSRLIGQVMQDAGLTVIPTLQWADERSYAFCFDGIEPGGTVSVSTIGVKRDRDASKVWCSGMDEAIKRLNPSCVVVYGGDIGYKFPCPARYLENHNTERFVNK